MEYEAFLVKIVCPKGQIKKAKKLLIKMNKNLPNDFEIDVEYEGIKSGTDFYGERIFTSDPQIINQINQND